MSNWYKDMIIKKLKEKIKENINLKTMYKTDRSFYLKCCKLFGSWNNTLDMLGEKLITEKSSDKNKQRIVGKYTAESTLKALLTRKEMGLPLSSREILIDNGTLYRACRKFYGTYENAINMCGWNYSDIVEDIHLMSHYGLLFEQLVGKMFTELNKKYKKGYNISLRPDFVFENNEWADAKLSEFTFAESETVEKYEPYCNKLTIIYLRGSRDKDEMITNKTNKVSIYKLIKELPIEKQENYTKELNDLWKSANNQDKLSKRKEKIARKKEKIEKRDLSVKKSVYKGVSSPRGYGVWITIIDVKGKSMYLGSFKLETDAAKAYDDYVISNNLNRRLNFAN